MTTTAHVVGTVADQMPEPPAHEDLFAVTYYFWSDNKWYANIIACGGIEDANRYAKHVAESGHRNVRIIRIPGDAPAQGERHE